MPEFLRLSTEEQADILSGMSVKLGRSAQVLQKDVWVCWALKELFGTQRGVRMAFIGMTLEGTPTIVTPTGVAGLNFQDEADTVTATDAQAVQRFDGAVDQRIQRAVAQRAR